MTTLSPTDFQFMPLGRGHIRVTFNHPIKSESASNITTDTRMVDDFIHRRENQSKFTQKELQELARFCKKS